MVFAQAGRVPLAGEMTDRPRRQLAAFLLAVLVLLSGCAVPGSSMGIVSLSGRIDSDRREEGPLQVRIVLPGEYGLGGPDRYFGDPEDYGHEDKVAVREVDAAGEFSVTHEVVYHMACLLLPPLGPFPRNPPPPVYLLGFSDSRDEFYAVGFHKGAVAYRAYRMPRKEEIPVGEAAWIVTGGSLTKTKKEGRPALDVSLEFKRRPRTVRGTGTEPLHEADGEGRDAEERRPEGER